MQLRLDLGGKGGAIFDCIAVGKRAEDFCPKARPPATFATRNGKFDGGFSGWMGDQTRVDEEPKAQRVDGNLGLPAEVALEEDGEVVSQSRESQSGLRRPESAQAQRRQSETVLQLLDDVLTIGSAVVIVPHGQGRFAGGRLVSKVWKT